MNRTRIIAGFSLLIVLVIGCEQRLVCGCVFPDSPLKGDWTLSSITYGLTQKTVTAAEAGFSESISFTGTTSNGTYQQLRNGLPIQSGHYSLSFPKGGSTEGFIYFEEDSTQQSFHLSDNRLSLSERSKRGAVLADGSLYTYTR